MTSESMQRLPDCPTPHKPSSITGLDSRQATMPASIGEGFLSDFQCNQSLRGRWGAVALDGVGKVVYTTQ
jgi:hypothetical protein